MNTIRDLSKEYEFSAVVSPNIVQRRVELQDTAYQWGAWDGVKKNVNTVGGKLNGWKVHIGLSLDINIITDNGQLMHHGRGGINFLTENQKIDDSYSKRFKTFENVSENSEDISEAIEIAFYPVSDSPIIEQDMPETYKKMVFKRMSMFMDSPAVEKEDELSGKVIVRFQIALDGQVQNIKVVKSSGKTRLDDHAIGNIKAASPYPVPPSKYFKGHVTFEIPLDFKK